MLKFSPIHPLPKFYKLIGWSRSTGERRRRTDPDFPRTVQIGPNREGVRDDDGAKYQVKLQKRAQEAAASKVNAFDTDRARAAAQRSIDVRRAKRDAKKQRTPQTGAAA